MTPDEIRGRVLHRDNLMLVIDKPAGLPVHAGPGGGPNLEQHFGALRFGLPEPPALAHRLDRDTSGCLILGRQRRGLARLGRLFQAGRIGKVYWAVVVGAPHAPEGTVDLALGKLARRDGWKMVADPKGQSAVTDYRILGAGDGLAWLELRPRTGRTHQIRVHCAALGCPILGETLYALRDPSAPTPGLHLHARAVSVPLKAEDQPVRVEAPLPPHLHAAFARCGWTDRDAAA